MKNKLTLLLTLLMALCLVFALASCGEIETDTESQADTEAESSTDMENVTSSDTDVESDTNKGTETETDTETESDVLEHEHVEEIIPAVAPTCTEEGLTEGKKCSECGEVLVEQEMVEAYGHKFENDYTCKTCGDVIVTSEGLEYELDAETNTYKVIGIGICEDSNIVIPYTYNELPVTTIGTEAFDDLNSLISVTIPNSVTSIGDSAFFCCTSIEKVIIGNSVTSIGERAFYGCESLKSLTIGEGVTLIGEEAFSECTSLTSVTIPNSVTSIGWGAFSGCSSLSHVAIGKGVTTIESVAFDNCYSLKSITIPNSVNSIGLCAFENCYKLVEVYNLSSLSITSAPWDNGGVGSYAKVVHTSLEEQSILETINDYIFMTWEGKYYLMEYVGNETELTLPESYNGNNYEIYQYAFYRDDITKVAIPNSVTSIGESAFKQCTSLASLTIPSGVTSIGYSAFMFCENLRSITIPNSVTFIGDKAFSGCTFKYNEYYLGNEKNPYVVLIKAKDKSITSCTINETTKVIYEDAFRGCTSLKSVTIGSSVTAIGSYAFRGCTSLTIYCEATEQPSGWNSNWNYSNRPVYWYSEEAPTTEGNYWHYGDNGEIVVWE